MVVGVSEININQNIRPEDVAHAQDAELEVDHILDEIKNELVDSEILSDMAELSSTNLSQPHKLY